MKTSFLFFYLLKKKIFTSFFLSQKGINNFQIAAFCSVKIDKYSLIFSKKLQKKN